MNRQRQNSIVLGFLTFMSVVILSQPTWLAFMANAQERFPLPPENHEPIEIPVPPPQSNELYVPTEAELAEDGTATVELGNITFDELPPFEEAPAIEISGGANSQEVQKVLDGFENDPTKTTWKKGDRVPDVLTVGDVGLDKKTLKDAEKSGAIDLETFAITSTRLLAQTTVNEVIDAVPGLSDLDLGAVTPILKIVEKIGKQYAQGVVGPLVDQKIKEIFKVDSPETQQILNSQLGEAGDLPINSIPGIENVPIGDFMGGKGSEATITEAGLSQIPVQETNFYGTGGPIDIPVATIDVAYGPSETGQQGNVYKPITGSDIEGFRVPCRQKHCAYLELADPANRKNSYLAGARWIAGGPNKSKGQQMVKGGSGLTGAIFGYREPTGRMPFGVGTNFKLVLLSVDETTGTGRFGVFKHKCNNWGCTPYIIGPFPFPSLKETQKIILGFDDPKTAAKNKEGSSSQFGDTSKAAGQFLDQSSGQLLAQADIPDDVCLQKILARTPPEFLENAKAWVPEIMSKARSEGLTESQTAYVMATALQDGGLGRQPEQDRKLSNIYGDYYPRGLVGLTGKPSYEKWSKELNVDLIKNPDLAYYHASTILVKGAKDGSFTGQKLSDYINTDQADFVGARQVINGNEDAVRLANYASQFQSALQECALQTNGGEGNYGGKDLCAAGSKFLRPVQGPVTSGFGTRIHPKTGQRKHHGGIDIGAPSGAPVSATSCGEVVRAGWEGGYGNSIVIKHRNNLYTRYGHLSKILVKKGQAVSAGNIIGYVGSTGLSTGPHLHLETMKGGPDSPRLNPKDYIPI